MKVTTALLCDFAQVREGLLFVSSGGVTRLYRDSLPAPMGICYAVVITLDRIELLRPHEFQIVVMDQDGGQVAEARGGFQLEPVDLEVGEKQQVPLAIDLRMAGVGSFGAHSVSLYIDGNLSHETSFYVVAPPEPSPAE